jgi:hypothetical protein
VNAAFVRREWGAVTFVLTVLVGAVAVPVALFLGNHAPAAQGTIPARPAPAVSVSASPSASPASGHSPAATPRP